MKVLVLNSGSSSQKTAVYEIDGQPVAEPAAPVWQGTLEWTGDGAGASPGKPIGASSHGHLHASNRAEALKHLLEGFFKGNVSNAESTEGIALVGHRVVHGGPNYRTPVLITADVKTELAKVSAFAPLHNGAELEGMEVVESLLPGVPQIAVFDTGFHRDIPDEAAIYPGPFEWVGLGIRRYGFHGINHQYCAERAAHMFGRQLDALKLVTCHLGNGCSLAAIRDGHSVDTTMGFTPLEGLMMGTRSGSVDPGILTYLMRQQHLQSQEIDDLLNKRSGLLGVSGVSSDMREVLTAREQGNPRAQLAFDMFANRLRAGIGAMVAVLGGIDALVFTAGIGENSPQVRAAACETLTFIGLGLDSRANAQCRPDMNIAACDSRVQVLVIRAQEDWAIANECWKLIRKPSN
ncbi:MAG TPA: acetate kinase [Candidatus Acidoferrales bacterium]|nr:acetate kinase [Candidatus Acidoferrales bacterium]